VPRSNPAIPREYDLENPDHIAILTDVRAAYANELARTDGAYGKCMYKPAAVLPFPKDTIRTALTALLDFAVGRRTSGLLDPSLRSSEVVETIQTCLTLLDDYLELPAGELPTDHVENATAGEAFLARLRWSAFAKKDPLPNATVGQDLRAGQANARLIVGEFDVSGLRVETRTGKLGGNWIEVTDGAARRLDHQTVAELCRCCGVELLKSGSKWSVWFCAECKHRVDTLNANAGVCVIPIGRHTFMHGVGVRGVDALRDPTLMTAFLGSANDLVSKQKRVSEWAAEIVRRNCASCALTSELIPIAAYLEAVSCLSRQAAFEAMREWWGSCKDLALTTSAMRSAENGLPNEPIGSTQAMTRIQARFGAERVDSWLRRLTLAFEWLLMAALLLGIASEASTDTSNRIALVCVGLLIWRMARDAFANTKTPWKTVTKVSLVISTVAVFVGLFMPATPSALESAVLKWCQTLPEGTLFRATLQARVLHDSSNLAEQCAIIEDASGRGFNGRAMFYALLICGTPVLAGALLSRDRFSEFDAMLLGGDRTDP